MAQRETSAAERIEQVILTSVRQILEHQDAIDFFAWARDSLPGALGLAEAGLEPQEERRLAVLLATAIWNATPLPAAGYRPCPMPEPPHDEECLCGSGLPYGACCANMGEAPDLPADLIWGMLLSELSERQLQEAIARKALPLHMLGAVAERWLEDDRPGRAASLLEPVFLHGDCAALDERFDAALYVLCDAYDRLDHYRKKRDFLGRMTRCGTPALRAAAWQRLSTIHIDEGDFCQAEAAFQQALRHGPNSPGAAILEITLLAAQHKSALARERAAFWRRKFVQRGDQDAALMAFLARAEEDPQDALVTSQAAAIDPMLLRLRDWLHGLAARPLPAYIFEAAPTGLHPPGERAMPPAGPEAAASPQAAAGRTARLHPPPEVRTLEATWRRAFTGSKPRSVQLTPPHGDDVWEDEGWLRLIERCPEAADSLDVIDDIATALYMHPESSLPWIAHGLMEPLLERAHSILAQSLPPAEDAVIPWTLKENRPALRLLFRRYLLQEESGDTEAASATLETLLRLNPDDNHGVRAELMNHYLRRRENERALELAGRFPDDLLADLAYGEVLALYRLGEQEHARRALTRAVGRLPRIPHYLTRKRVRQPALSTNSVTPGDDDQAWLYREAMRDVWEAEPGVLAWLKQLTA